jgi:hypothetical protein
MMYILDKEEYNSLVTANILYAKQHEQTLQELCTRVANSEILTEGTMSGKPWGCVLSVEHEWYCDHCPVQDICPLEWKHWSK